VYWPDLGHWHQTSAPVKTVDAIVGHVNRAPAVVKVEADTKKDLIRGIVHARGVYSTFRSSTSKYSLKVPKSTSARAFRESCMHGTWRIRVPTERMDPIELVHELVSWWPYRYILHFGRGKFCAAATLRLRNNATGCPPSNPNFTGGEVLVGHGS